MTLHPQAVAHLAAAADAPPVHRMTVREARLALLGYLQLQRPRRPVAGITHTYVPGPTADLPVRVYRPDDAPGPRPAVLMLHGSGWVGCTIEVSDEPARALALDTGFVVVSVNYQKAPEHPYPVPLDDSEAAFDWLLANAADLGVDPGRVAVIGDSAGGNLAAGLCLRRRDRGLPLPAAQALLYPALARETGDDPVGDGLSPADMRWFWDHYLGGHDADAYAAPALASDLAGLPPTFVATPEHDVLRPDGVRYAAELDAAGVSVTHVDYAGMIHGFYWMDGVLDDAVRLQRDVAAWLRRELGPDEPGDEAHDLARDGARVAAQ